MELYSSISRVPLLYAQEYGYHTDFVLVQVSQTKFKFTQINQI